MTEAWRVDKDPISEYRLWVKNSRSLFASPEWAEVLESIGAHALYAWHAHRRFGAIVACFRRGPIRVGVLGFPVMSAAVDAPHGGLQAIDIRRIGVLAGVRVLRINRSMVGSCEPTIVAARPDVWIDDLPHWTLEGSRRRKKDVAFARRANPGLVIEDSDSDADAAICFELYSRTVSSHGANLHYKLEYFRQLMRLGGNSTALQVFLARDTDRSLRGFAVLAIDRDVAYYLHGASDIRGKREGVADLLLESLVTAARAKGAQKLSLMASPWEQQGLIRFKQKWGGATGLCVTDDVATDPIGMAACVLSRWMGRNDRQAAANWQQGVDDSHP